MRIDAMGFARAQPILRSRSSDRSRFLASRPSSATPRRAAAGVALEAGAVAHQGEVAAFAAGLAFIALGARLGALLGRDRARAGADIGVGTHLAAGKGQRLLLHPPRRPELQLGPAPYPPA